MKENLEIRFKELSDILMSEMNEDGFWTGELSSSALGVSVAVAALHFYDPQENQTEIEKGLEWLMQNQNTDGGYGDTPESPSNISTSLLVYAALNLYSEKNKKVGDTQQSLAVYLSANQIDLSGGDVAKTILAHYKTDYTFSVPILTMCALCGIPKENAYQKIPQLPFELALLPQRFYRLLNLSVVSYAIPALIAVGIVIFKKKKSGRISRAIRAGAEKKALKLLQKSLPESGGFLEAIPLTAFVALSLINAGYHDMDVVTKGIAFLKRTQREDGGWPIDVDLSTWVSTLSVKALGNRLGNILSSNQKKLLSGHLLSVQNKIIHPFNGTPPGGWGWTNYTGSVPDCDDTPGAMLALLRLNDPQEVKAELLAGVDWLFNIQNSDGGFPTFSKGWGKLPFDQSCADLTGHCVLALATVAEHYSSEDPALKKKLNRSIGRALHFLVKHQNENGSWSPLWFGNQQMGKHDNPVYGTARVLNYFYDAAPSIKSKEIQNELSEMIKKAEQYLLGSQNSDGSWGGARNIPGTMEETALAVAALVHSNQQEVCEKGFAWLDQTFRNKGLPAAPIGLYFASLWYDEKLYPLTAYLEALSKHLDKGNKFL